VVKGISTCDAVGASGETNSGQKGLGVVPKGVMAKGNFAWRPLRAVLYWSSWPNSLGVVDTSSLFRGGFAVGGVQ
jgi:hypothetical protein